MGSELLFQRRLAQECPCRCTVKPPFKVSLVSVDFYIKERKFLNGEI
jgi:hypothetical protein